MELKQASIRPTDPQDVTVQMNLRVPFFYREQLVNEAHRQGMSINRLIVTLLVRQLPPER